jgi:hypothetical protein
MLLVVTARTNSLHKKDLIQKKFSWKKFGNNIGDTQKESFFEAENKNMLHIRSKCPSDILHLKIR